MTFVRSARVARLSSMHTVIAYDVSCDRKRARLGTVLLGYGARVQKSVFEAKGLHEAAYLRMRSRAERLIDPATDRIRYWRLCAACAGRIEHFGAGPPVDVEVGEVEFVGLPHFGPYLEAALDRMLVHPGGMAMRSDRCGHVSVLGRAARLRATEPVAPPVHTCRRELPTTPRGPR